MHVAQDGETTDVGAPDHGQVVEDNVVDLAAQAIECHGIDVARLTYLVAWPHPQLAQDHVVGDDLDHPIADHDRSRCGAAIDGHKRLVDFNVRAKGDQAPNLEHDRARAARVERGAQ